METRDATRWIDAVVVTPGTPLIVTAPFGKLEIAGNLTAQSSANGYVLGWSGEGTMPVASSVQTAAGQVRDNFCRLKAGASGTYRFDAFGAPTKIWFDIQAW